MAQTTAPVIGNLQITTNTTEIFGTAEIAATIEVYSNTDLVGTGTADGSGNYSITIPMQPTGVAIGTKATTSGNTQSEFSNTKLVVYEAPNAQTAQPSILTTTITPATTSISGSAEANSAIEAFSGSTSIGTATANGSGAYTVNISGHAVSDIITVKATATGKTVSIASAGITVTAVVVSQTAQPIISIGSITTATLAVPGSAEANSTVEAFNGSTSIGTATANASGIYSITIASQAVGGVITVKATSSGKTVSNASTALTVIAATSPQTAIPVIGNSVLYSTGTALNGTAENNATVKIKNGNVEIATATANSTGLWNATFLAQATGVNLTATATASGKTESLASAAIVVTTAPVVTTTVVNTPITGNTPAVKEPIVEPTKAKNSNTALIIASIALILVGLMWFGLKAVKWAFLLVFAGIGGVIYFISTGKSSGK